MSTFQIRATVHASANYPRAAAWAHFTSSARLSISVRKPIRDTKNSDKSTAVQNERLNNVNNKEGQNIQSSSLQSAVITNSPFEINNFGNKQANNERTGSQSSSTTSLSRTTSPLPLDYENMPPQDFIAHNQGYIMYFFLLYI